MEDTKKTKADTKTGTQNPPAPSASKEPAFPLERLRRDCFTLFKITPSTFDGVTCGLKGNFTVEEMRDKIQTWLNKRVIPAKKKEGK